MTTTYSRRRSILVFFIAALSVAGCVSNQPKNGAAQASDQDATAARANTADSAAPAEAASKRPCNDSGKAVNNKDKSKKDGKQAAEPTCNDAPAEARPAGYYNLSKNKPVTDSSKVEAGQGTIVKGINDWEGEVTGLPTANSKFVQLKIGMPMRQVTDLVGPPTDEGAYITGKAFIPFYFGSDKTRWEAVYKGQGRLIFAGNAGFSSGHYLIWIIYNSHEAGYR